MLSTEDRAAARRGLRRGLLSLGASLVLYFGVLALLVPWLLPGISVVGSVDELYLQLYERGPNSLNTGTFSLSETLFRDYPPWRPLVLPTVASGVAALVLLVVRLTPGPRRLALLVLAHLVGAVHLVTGIRLYYILFDGDLPKLFPELAVGVVLAGFGARAALRNGARSWTDDTGVVVDAWFAAVFLLGALVASDVYSRPDHVGISWVGYGFTAPPSAAFLFGGLLVVPLLLVAVGREVAWSVIGGRARAAVAPEERPSTDGGRTDVARSGTQASRGAAWALGTAIRRDGRAVVGAVLLLALLLVTVLAGPRYPFSADEENVHEYVSQTAGLLSEDVWFFLAEHVAVAAIVALVAAGFGLLVARLLAARSVRERVEAVAVDPIANVLQLPTVAYIGISLPFLVLFDASHSIPGWKYSVGFGIFGGLAVGPLVARVAGEELERGRGWNRAVVRGVGVATSGAAVVLLGFGWYLYDNAMRGPVFQFSVGGTWFNAWTLLVAVVVPLFLLGEGLRTAARRDPALDGSPDSP